MSAIDDKYAQLGGVNGFLGVPVNDETKTPDGRGTFRHFQTGSIYWTPTTGAHEVHGDIRVLWAKLGWEQSYLGFPMTDETVTPDGAGRFNDFEGGSIYWTPDGGPYEVKKVFDPKAQSAYEATVLQAASKMQTVDVAQLKDVAGAPLVSAQPFVIEQMQIPKVSEPVKESPATKIHAAEQIVNIPLDAATLEGATRTGISTQLAAQLSAEAKKQAEEESVNVEEFLSPAQQAALYLGEPELAYALNPDSFAQIKARTPTDAKLSVDASVIAKGADGGIPTANILWPMPTPGDTSGSLTGRDRPEGGATAADLRDRIQTGSIQPHGIMQPGGVGNAVSNVTDIHADVVHGRGGMFLAQNVMDRHYRLGKVAITLSGGGAKGDFEIGALRYIYDHLLGNPTLGLPPRPDIVTGTSVGAINGAKLAEGYDDSLAQLEGIWDELRTNSDMYLPVLNLDELFRSTIDSAGRAAIPIGLSLVLTGGAVVLTPLTLLMTAIGLGAAREEALRAVQRLNETRSIFNITPIERRLNQYSPYWSATGPGLRGSSLAVGHDRAGRTLVVARGYDDGCYVCVRTSAPEATAATYSPWIRLGRRIDSDPVLLTDTEGFVTSVVARKAEDGRFHELALTGDASRRDGWYTSWTPHGYPLREQFEALGVGGESVRWTSAPTLGRGSAWIDTFLFARGTDNFPYSQSFDRLRGRWEPFRVMGWPLPIASEIAFGRSSDNWKFAFARRANRQIVCCPAAPGDDRWMRWDSFGGEAMGDITAATNGDGRLHVFVVGTDTAVWVRSQAAARGNNWEAWRRIGNVATSTPAAARGLNETLNVFVRGLDYSVWHKSAESSTGSFAEGDAGWHSLGAPSGAHFLTDPVVVRRPNAMLEVYAVGNDKKVYVNAQVARAGTIEFTGWQTLGGAVWTGIELRLAAVAVETGELRHIDESGRFVESSVEPLVGVPAGVMASASIPAIFPAVPMNGRAWVDGGVRSITPIKAAVDAGAQVVYAVCCSPAVLPPDVHFPMLAAVERVLGQRFSRVPRSWSEAGLIDVGMRAVSEMLITSIQQSELTPVNPWRVPVYVIQPSFDLHDALTINPALIRIARGYGWMRASEATTLPDPSEAMRSSDAIIRARHNIYLQESRFNLLRLAATSRGHAPGQWLLPEEGRDPDAADTLRNCDAAALSAINFNLPELRRLKAELAVLIDDRRALFYELPPDSENWITGWEDPMLAQAFPNGAFGEITVSSRGGAVAMAATGSPR